MNTPEIVIVVIVGLLILWFIAKMIPEFRRYIRIRRM
jgi:hypothetical protein